MQVVSVELYTDQKNGAVIKLPERRFPGVLVQADTLEIYIEDLRDLLNDCKNLQKSEDVCESLLEVIQRLESLHERYEKAIEGSQF